MTVQGPVKEQQPDGMSHRGWGGGFGTQKFVSKKWPDQILPIVNFLFSHDGHFGLRGGGGYGGARPAPALGC